MEFSLKAGGVYSFKINDRGENVSIEVIDRRDGTPIVTPREFIVSRAEIKRLAKAL